MDLLVVVTSQSWSCVGGSDEDGISGDGLSSVLLDDVVKVSRADSG